MSDKHPTRQFVVTGVVGQGTTSNGNHYISCRLQGEEGRLAIWGTPNKNMEHVALFRERAKGGFPITLECEWTQPTSQFWKDAHGHRYWVYERFAFRVVG